MPTAQATALRAEPKATMKPSPMAFTSRPPCSCTCCRTSSSWARRTSRAASSPRRVVRSVEPSTSVKRTVTVPSGSVSATGALLHGPQSHRLRHTLERVLAAILERHARRRARQTPHGVRHQHLARRRGARYPRRDVDGSAVDVVPLADDVAGVDAEMQLQADGVAGATTAQGTLDGLPRRGEHCQQSVAHELTLDR